MAIEGIFDRVRLSSLDLTSDISQAMEELNGQASEGRAALAAALAQQTVDPQSELQSFTASAIEQRRREIAETVCGCCTLAMTLLDRRAEILDQAVDLLIQRLDAAEADVAKVIAKVSSSLRKSGCGPRSELVTHLRQFDHQVHRSDLVTAAAAARDDLRNRLEQCRRWRIDGRQIESELRAEIATWLSAAIAIAPAGAKPAPANRLPVAAR